MNDTSTAADPRSASAEHQFQNLHEIVAKARQNLNQNDWDYIIGGTESETTLKRNRMALDTVAFRPRVLRDVSRVDAGTTFLGRKLRLPLLLAPVGSLEQFADGGGATAARAAGQFGIAHMLSSVCKPGMEEVAQAAPDALRIYQLYVRGDAGWTDDHVQRAINNGYQAFCLTVDTSHYSRRERDLAKRHVTSGRRSVTQGGTSYQAGLDWGTVKRIKDKFRIPLILKGIGTAEDAAIAVEHGVEWIYISNHGGRQLDHGLGSFEVLRQVAKAVKGRAKLMVDGSFNRGADIVKGIAAGADIVGLGRMQCYALSAGGIPAVQRMLELLEDEMQRALGLLGVNTFAELDESYLTAAPAVTEPHVLSAFPLLDIAPYRY